MREAYSQALSHVREPNGRGFGRDDRIVGAVRVFDRPGVPTFVEIGSRAQVIGLSTNDELVVREHLVQPARLVAFLEQDEPQRVVRCGHRSVDQDRLFEPFAGLRHPAGIEVKLAEEIVGERIVGVRQQGLVESFDRVRLLVFKQIQPAQEIARLNAVGDELHGCQQGFTRSLIRSAVKERYAQIELTVIIIRVESCRLPELIGRFGGSA